MNTQTKESSDLLGQRKMRIDKLNKLRSIGIDPFPPKTARQYKIAEIVEKFSEFEGKDVVLAGRLISLREHGKLIFGDMRDMSGKIQLYIKEENVQGSKDGGFLGFEELNLVDVGDILEAKGKVTKTERGEISLEVSGIRILTKTIRPMPTAMEDKEERYRRRYVDMNLHPEVRERFERRTKFWQAVRDFMNSKGFLEINIPVLEHTTGGADAKPFVTHYDALGEDFYLRISHELPLKRLLGAGFEKVYDVGPRFRNEGFSDEHLPEHVAMEWYWAYADYEAGIELTIEMFKFILKAVYGKLKFDIKGFHVDLEKEWERIDFATIIKERFGIEIFTDPLEKMVEMLKQNGVEVDEDINKNRAIDSLWKLIRKTIAGPAILTGEPKFLSPLAKTSLEDDRLTYRFHPVIAGSELANAFGELNDPLDQLERFKEQEAMREGGDDEAQMLDIDFVEMLEYGMPPAVGFGLSERVFWFFENVSAKEGVPFPQLKRHTDEVTKKIYPELNLGHKEKQSLNFNLESLTNDTNRKSDAVDTQNFEQDFSNKVVIVVNKELPGWQIGNTIAHISAYIGHKLDEKFDTGEYFVTKDGKNHPRNSQYPIIILEAKPGQMSNLMQAARESGLLYHGFIKEMIETTNDKEIVEILNDKSDSEIEYLGVGFFGKNDEVDRLTKKFSLYK